MEVHTREGVKMEEDHILVRRRVLRRTPRMVAPVAYCMFLRMPVHFLSTSLNLEVDNKHMR